MEEVYSVRTVDKQPLLYKILYILIHTLWGLAEIVYDAILFICGKFDYLIYIFFQKHSEKKLEPLLLSKKVPSHLTVILGDENPSFQNLANFVIWSLCVGIPFISFYDHRGDLKQQEDKFQKIVLKLVKEGDHVLWHESMKNSYKNGFTGKKIHVKILTPNDGKLLVVRVTEELVDSSDNIDIEYVNNVIQKHFEFPDPDLAIYCSKKCSSWGYPPWQVRLTEFLNLERHKTVTPDVFMNFLYRYSKCEQRVGK